MTIDERLEAFTQSCELLLADSLEHTHPGARARRGTSRSPLTALYSEKL